MRARGAPSMWPQQPWAGSRGMAQTPRGGGRARGAGVPWCLPGQVRVSRSVLVRLSVAPAWGLPARERLGSQQPLSGSGGGRGRRARVWGARSGHFHPISMPRRLRPSLCGCVSTLRVTVQSCLPGSI